MLANSLPKAKLIVFTRHGTMARYVSNLRPTRATIFAFTPSEQICRQLALCWGTYPILLEFTGDPNKTIDAAAKYLCEERLTNPNDNLVILTDLRASDAQVDSIQVRRAKGGDSMDDASATAAQESMMD